ncbi:MAG: flagellar brake protein [Rhodocyclaceae bacterium]
MSEPVRSEADLSPYFVTEPLEIDMALRALVDSKTIVTLYPPAGAPRVLGWLAAVDGAGGRFVFETIEPLATQDGALLFVATLNGVKLQFTCPDAPVPVSPSCIALAVPPHIIRLQRRRYSRFEAPLGLPFRAQFGVGGKQCEAGVDNLALGGIGLRLTPAEGKLLYIGRQLRGVRIALGHDGDIVVDLEVRSVRTWSSYLLGKLVLVGCRFVGLPAAAEAQLRHTLDRLAHR